MFALSRKLAAAAVAAVSISAATVPASAFGLGDLAAANMAFDQQFNAFVANGMNDLMAQCAQARANGFTGHGCFDGYNPQTFSDANTGGNAIIGSYWANQAATGAALDGWSNAFNGYTPLTDGNGGSFWGYNGANTYWADNYGTVYGMDGYNSPDPLANFTQLFPSW